ncbi:MAG: zf-HC2 domain-containing protein [Acidobacteriota bacterium]
MSHPPNMPTDLPPPSTALPEDALPSPCGDLPTETCRDAINFLLAYLEDDLSASARESFEAHVAMCPPCQDYMDSYRETIALSREACGCDQADQHEPMPPALVSAILAACTADKTND